MEDLVDGSMKCYGRGIKNGQIDWEKCLGTVKHVGSERENVGCDCVHEFLGTQYLVHRKTCCP